MKVPVPVKRPARLISASVVIVRLFAPNAMALAKVITPDKERNCTLSVHVATPILMAPVPVVEPILIAAHPSLIIAYSAALKRISPAMPAPIPMPLLAVNCEMFSVPAPLNAFATARDISVSVTMFNTAVALFAFITLLTVIRPAAPLLRVMVPAAAEAVMPPPPTVILPPAEFSVMLPVETV